MSASTRAGLLAAAFLLGDAGASRAGVVQWDLNGGLDSSTGGAPLVEEAAAPETAPSVGFEDSAIANEVAQVARFSRGTYFRLTHGLPANGGGARLNRYSLILDVMFPDRSPSGGWAVLLQTDAQNTDDGDWVVNPNGNVGISGRYGGFILDGEWNRLVLVVDNTLRLFQTFINGQEAQKLIGSAEGIDGRFSLGREVLLFADENGENAEGLLGSVQLRDYRLTPAEVLALAGPVADGIPIPEVSCPRGLSCALDRAAGKVTLSWEPAAAAQGGTYEVRRNGALVGTAPAGQSSFTDAVGQAPGDYDYELSLSGADPAACPHLPLLCGVTVLPPGQFLLDDFEGYQDDVELITLGGWLPRDENNPVENATWSVVNPGNRLNPPGEDGTPPTGRFIISDSDWACCDNPGGTGMSHDLWSPTFSTKGSSVVWLHADCSAQMNNNGQCVFDIDVSLDDGEEWTNVFRRVAPSRNLPPAATIDNADGFYGRLHVDLSAAAADKPSVRLRFRHFEPSDDWWIALDNLLVDDRPLRGGATFLFGPARFQEGIPAAWKVVSNATPANAGDETWTTGDPCKRHIRNNAGKFPHLDGRGIHRLSEPFAILDDDCPPSPAKDEYLITPAFDLRFATRAYFHYKSEIVADNAAIQEVLLSLDGGTTFETTPIFSYSLGGLFDPGEDTFYAERVFEVPDAVGQPGVAFAFHYQGAGDLWYWAIDDVRVSADGEGLPVRTCPNRDFRVDSFDPATGSVTCRWNPIPGDEGFRVLANGSVITSPDLPASATSYVDRSPPAGGTVAYSLQSLKGGSVELECPAPAITVFACPRDLACCVDQAAMSIRLSWTNGLNLAGTGYRIVRNGVPVRTVPLTATTYTDAAVPGPGVYDYELILNGGDPAQCPGLPLRCRATVAGGDIIWSDDFECYRKDEDLLAAGWEVHEENQPLENAFWTLLNPGNRGNPPRPDGTPTLGKFIVSDSDAAGGDDRQGTGMSHDLWSPSIDCTGRTTVWLHMACSAILNNNGVVVFDVDVSADRGASWENVFRRVAPQRGVEPLPLADIPDGFPGGPQVGNVDAFFGPLDLDVSALAAGKPDVRFRLRQFEPSDDWWIAVDDVRVDSTPVEGGPRKVLARESFDGGLPGDWVTRSEGPGTAPWRGEDLCQDAVLTSSGGILPDARDGRQLHRLDGYFAIATGDDACAPAVQDEQLLTPVLDCSEARRVWLHFKSNIRVTAAVAEVLLSLDGGDSFDAANPVFSYHRGAGLLRDANNAEVVYNQYILEVPAAAGQRRVVFAFHFWNPNAQTTYWAIDDVEVTADGGGPQLAGFIRGDCNRDGKVDITDAVFNLSYQFLGGAVPECLEACNADSIGANDLTDPIYFLGYLFLGGPAPPAPGPLGCGKDIEPGPLSCDNPSC